ncbi:hypothetical protein D3C71_2053130 [compost metagenome]
MRQGDWKLILQKVKSGNPIPELYNLKQDPQEQNNLAASSPQKVEALRKIITKAHVENRDFPLVR